MAQILRSRSVVLAAAAVAVLLVLSWVPAIEAGKRRVHIPDDLDDVEDNEEDEDWKAWGKPKPRPRPKFDPPPDFQDGMDLGKYQREMIKRQFGPSMGFAKLRIDVPRELEEAPRLARTWTELLKTGSIDAKVIAVDKNTIMFTIPDGQDSLEVKDFVLSQPEAYEFKLGQSTFRRPGDPELDVVVERMRKERAKKKDSSSVKEEL
ncbi:LRP chaperone MESD [Marchantia polymorpha subsp. ruderalis]|uniref:Mesoderm development candidate 2 n=1 Tax=Marchantia polymorpha TaxID=3197 RepID=A0A2R6XCA2_MARPO|nr:hypothetical protein MARPO_0023s0066 [Marchantia polymorpha]BBN01875.1 hypothetical protein Mp_2g11000 [Marchantia polymorpha subsp. ruderalis]|eukprot:PTQ43737.1 hypothetical protein MARPO_0023s0066 [Marchantia polymorpha]